MHVIKYIVQTPHYLIPIHAVADGTTKAATQSSQPCVKETEREDCECERYFM